MSKTPFEIRLELLKMAKEMLEVDYFSQKDQLVNAWNMEVNRAMEEKTMLPKHPIIPPYPTAADVIEKASILNAFVSKV